MRDLLKRLEAAGGLVFNSEPFKNWPGFFAQVDDAAKQDEGGFCDHAYRRQQEIMEAWAGRAVPVFDSLGVRLTWDTWSPAYGFVGNAFPDREGELLADFPIRVNQRTLPKHNLHKSCRVHLSGSSGEYTGRLTLRQQFGEPLLDVVTFTRSLRPAPHRTTLAMRELPVKAVSSEEAPLKQRVRGDYDGHACHGRGFFYFEPEGLTFDRFSFFGDKAIVPVERVSGKIYQTPEALNRSFYLMCCEGIAETSRHSLWHLRNPEGVRKLVPPYRFPASYITQFEPAGEGGKRDFSIIFSRMSSGDYCIWMRPEGALKTVLEHVATLGFEDN